MKTIRVSALVGGFAAILFFGETSTAAKPEPPAFDKPPADERPIIGVGLKEVSRIDWALERNFASGLKTKNEDGKYVTYVHAVDVTDLDQTQRRDAQTGMEPLPPADPSKPDRESKFAVWLKKYDDPKLKFRNGFASVVDEQVFTDLLMVDGEDASKLDVDGVEVGRVKLEEYNPVDLVQFLVASGIVDANIHISAHVTGSYSISERGHWFSLSSDDPYWTNKANRARYSFGIHIANDGTIRLVNRRLMGKVRAAVGE